MLTPLFRWRDRQDKVAFVLSGGGPFGAIQVGQLKALHECGVRPDIVIGASVGALNGAQIAYRPDGTGVETLIEIWSNVRPGALFPGGRLGTLKRALGKSGSVYANSGVRQLIANYLPLTFEELALDLHVVATDVATGDERWFTEGNLTDPLLASTALPGMFPTVEIDGSRYFDGGIANNIPFSRAAEMGASVVYVLNVNTAGQGRELARPHQYMLHGMVLARSQRYRRDLEASRGKVKVHEMPVAQVGHITFTNLAQTQRLIDAGYDGALGYLTSLNPSASSDK